VVTGDVTTGDVRTGAAVGAVDVTTGGATAGDVRGTAVAEGTITGGSTVTGPVGDVLGGDTTTWGLKVGPLENPVVPDDVGDDVSMGILGLNVSISIVGIGVATFIVGLAVGCGDCVVLLMSSSCGL
jgi:hypothetical protein